jgi:transcriptional regulator with XRE-family HTH domain
MESVEPEDDSFGGLLRMYRRRSGLSQIELAEKARISSRAISDLERGVRSRAYHPTVEALAGALSLREDERERFSSAVRRARSHPRPRLRVTDAEQDRRVAALSNLILSGRCRLISVTGPPASGKTRLAIEAGRQLSDAQAVRLDYVSLEGYARGIDVVHAVEAISAPVRSRRVPSELPESLQKPHLLILDNLEHLLPLGSEIDQLLSADRSLTIIVVSRVSTQMAGEEEIVLPPPP